MTLTWKNITQGREYRLTYNQVTTQPSTQQTTTAVFIGRQMRTFTARKLRPRTDHEFCISVKVLPYKEEEDEILYQTLSCTKVTTVDPVLVEGGVYNAAHLVVATVAGVIALVGGLLGCFFIVARRYNRKRTQGYSTAVPRGSDFEGFLEGAGGFGDENIMVPLSETYENESALKWAEEDIFDETDLDEIRRSVVSTINPIATTTRLLPPSLEQKLVQPL